MRYLPALLAAAALVSAQNESISDYLPACSIDCLTTAIADATTCTGTSDLECFCIADNYRAIYDSAVACVLQACGNDVSVGEVLPAAAHMCEVVVARASSTSAAASTGTSAAAGQSTGAATTTSTNGDSTTSPTSSPTSTGTATPGSNAGGRSAQVIAFMGPLVALVAAANV
ncbi:hypothetical protein N656DRAFT_772083 [Canariomyces notabilis]|uniref:CFEM domain-containing protein n=1 Tax=Canariomyces notabilis TaxID=2074819 RepID=A0AAN6QGY9_9PEZI|nr:hypothetical protein N656DRAFT_772083 [Canariomyces arenarius]